MSIKILWLEDDELLRKNASTRFKQYGFDLTIVTRSDEALNKIKSEEFTVVILDLNITPKDGVKLMTESLDYIPIDKILVYSGYIKEWSDELNKIGFPKEQTFKKSVEGDQFSELLEYIQKKTGSHKQDNSGQTRTITPINTGEDIKDTISETRLNDICEEFISNLKNPQIALKTRARRYEKDEFFKQSIKEFKKELKPFWNNPDHLFYAIQAATFADAKKEMFQNGVDLLAQEMQVEEQRAKTKMYWYKGKILNWLLYQLWDLSSVFGQSVSRWLLVTISILLLFGVLYHPLLITEFKEVSWFPNDGFWEIYYNYTRSLFISITTFTTHSDPEAIPINFWARFFIAIEVLMGTSMIGVFVSMLVARMLKNFSD